MTWLYLPSTCSPSATDTAAPNSPCDPWHQYQPFVVLSGTPTQRPSSWNGWARRDWIHALSGMTLSPSTATRGVDEWISSLPASPANRSPLPELDRVLTMTDGSGRTSHGSFVTWLPDTCCWRTSDSLLPTDYPKSSMTLPSTGSMWNGVCMPRRPLVRRIAGNESGLWPGVTAMDAYGSGRPNVGADGYQRQTMTDAARLWGTPVARDDQKTPEAHLAMKARMGGGRTEPTSLTVQAKMWPTPRAHDGTSGGDKASTHPKSGGDGLQTAASRHAPTTTPDGNTGSAKADLNPFFVAALMGLPVDWLTHSTSEVTVWCRNALLKPGVNSSNGLTDE